MTYTIVYVYIYRLELTRVNYKKMLFGCCCCWCLNSSNNKQDKIYVHTKYCLLLVDWLVGFSCLLCSNISKKRSINNYMLNNQYIYNNFFSSFSLLICFFKYVTLKNWLYYLLSKRFSTPKLVNIIYLIE